MMRSRLYFYLVLGFFCGILAACGNSPSAKQGNAAEEPKKDGDGRGQQASDAFSRKLEAFTGGPTKAVWMQHMHPQAKDTYAQGRSFYLAGIDTRDGKGVREIIAKKGSYSRPIITPDGKQIVYTKKTVAKKNNIKHYTAEIHIVGWDGKKARKLRAGYATDVWKDPDTGKIWVYAGDAILPSGRIDLVSEKLIRFPLDDPSEEELVWSDTKVGLDNIQLSRDGLRAGALFPWPNAGMMNLANTTWQKYSDGCWTSHAPDNSYLSWVFDGAHRNLQLYPAGGKTSWTVNLSKGASKEGFEVYHPRWSNHVRFLAMSGPYREGKGVTEKDVGRLGKGGKGVEIFLGKFTSDFKKMESFFQLTDNAYGNFYPDLWVADGDKVDVAPEVLAGKNGTGNSGAAAGNPLLGEPWPSDTKGLVLKWENANSENMIRVAGKRRTTQMEAFGAARIYQHYEMDVTAGSFSAEEELAAEVAKELNESKAWSLEFSAVVGGPEYHFEVELGQSVPEETKEEGAPEMGPPLILSIDDKRISLSRAGEEQFRLTTPDFRVHQLNHLALVAVADQVTLYLNGEKQDLQVVSATSLVGNLSPGLMIGGNSDSPHRSVFVDQVALYNRALEPTEIQKHHRRNEARSAAREYADPIQVKVKLAEISQGLSRADFLPYAGALAVYTYDVVEQTGGALESGELKIGEQIAVAHWTAFDRKILPGFPRKIGEESTLFLEYFEDHPRLETQRINTGDASRDLPFFYDISVPVLPVAEAETVPSGNTP